MERDFSQDELLSICKKLNKEATDFKRDIEFSKQKVYSQKQDFFYRMALDICLNKVESAEDLVSLTEDFLAEISESGEISDPDYHQVVDDLETANSGLIFTDNILDILSSAKIDHKISPISTEDLFDKLKKAKESLDKDKLMALKELKSLESSQGEFAKPHDEEDVEEEEEEEPLKPMEKDDDTVIPQDTDIAIPLSKTKSLSAPQQMEVSKMLDSDKNIRLPGMKNYYEKQIAEASLLEDLIKVADSLDKAGLHKEAEVIDVIITKVNRG